MDTLIGSVERITYYNPENGYSVLRLRPERGRMAGMDREGLVTVTGNLPEISAGEHLRLSGQWRNHPKHGLQFQIEVCEQTVPATIEGIQRYLGSGLIKGIGPRLAERIVAHFGKATLEIIESQPGRLQEVEDIGPKRSGLIGKAWEEQKQVKEIMLFLHSYGISTNLAVKIYKEYGEQALQIVKTDPYRLARDIYGIGFKTADKIAQAIGLPADHPQRLEAGVVYALSQATDDGHVYTPAGRLVEQAAALLGVTAELISPAIERLKVEERVREEQVPYTMKKGNHERHKTHGNNEFTGPPEDGLEDSDMVDRDTGGVREKGAVYGQAAIYLTPLFYSESGSAEKLRDLAKEILTRLSDLPPAFIQLDPDLSIEQQSAIRTALSQPVSVLTGGPGTGKTTALRALIAVMEMAHKSYALASPTGRAAKRLSQATGQPASTIHRLLGFSPREGFKYNENNPLNVDLLVIDEASMLDLVLAYHLLKALRPGTHLLLVGDVDQLPSVGAGDVLRDVIASELAPVTRLSQIFRQAANSQIITNAHRINRSEFPIFSTPEKEIASQGTLATTMRGKIASHSSLAMTMGDANGAPRGDFFFFNAETPEAAAEWVRELVCQRIPSRFGFHPTREIQVLAPIYRGAAGVTALNEALQASLNPSNPLKPEKRLFGQLLRPGDKVMQIQNNYDKDVYNGDIGYLAQLDTVEQNLTVEFEERRVTYEWSEADQLMLAYAVSVHKSQGAEFPAVVIPLLTQHYLMLQRNLLYTAVTRARKLCVLVGSRQAIGMAVRNNKVAERYSALSYRLRDR